MAVRTTVLIPSSVTQLSDWSGSTWVNVANAISPTDGLYASCVMNNPVNDELITPSLQYSLATPSDVPSNAVILAVRVYVRGYVADTGRDYSCGIDVLPSYGITFPLQTVTFLPTPTDSGATVQIDGTPTDSSAYRLFRDALIAGTAKINLAIGCKTHPVQAGVSAFISSLLIEIDWDTPPAQTPYNGPVATLYPTAQSVLTSHSRPWTTPANLVGVNDSAFAVGTTTLPGTLDPASGSDELLLTFTAPAGQENALIFGWTYKLKNVSGSRSDAGPWEKSVAGLYMRNVTSGTAVGGENALHEMGSTPADHDAIMEYDDPLTPHPTEGPEFIGLMLLGSGSGLNAADSCNYFNTWTGVNVRVAQANIQILGYTISISLDTLEMKTYYWPVDTGSLSTQAIVEAVSFSRAGEDGAPDAHPDWGAEVPVVNPANLAAIDSLRSTFSVNALKGQTHFYRIRIAAGSFTAHLHNNRKELRLRWKGRIGTTLADFDFYQFGYMIVNDLVIVTRDKKRVLRSRDNPMYDVHNFKIGSYGGNTNNYDRDRGISLDISGLTDAQIAELNDQSFDLLLGFAVYNAGWLPGMSAATASINGVTVTVSSTPKPPSFDAARNVSVRAHRRSPGVQNNVYE